jgi:hypothetical protein
VEQRQISRTIMVGISFKPFSPFLAIVSKKAIVFQGHRAEVDCAVQAIGHVGIREHFLMELVYNPEE